MKILVATDGSEPVRRACERLVSMVNEPAEVRVLTVLSYSFYPYALWPGGGLADEDWRAAKAEDEAEIATHDARLILEKVGFEVTLAHRYGNPPDEILAEVAAWKPDLLVMGRRGVRGIERMIGSVSEHVVRDANVATLLVP